MNAPDRQPTCADRIDGMLQSELETLSAFEDAGFGDAGEEHGEFFEYGLSFDLVEADTFDDQPEPYYRYQLSWGGPSDEFRFYGGSRDTEPYSIEYWFLDWGDGAKIVLEGESERLLLAVWECFAGLGLPGAE